MHLKTEKGLQIKKSHIPKAGLGLYALKEFNRGDVITPYGGELITTRDPNLGGDYMLELKKGPPRVLIDGSPKVSNKSTGGYSNSCKPPDKRAGYCNGQNAHFEINRRTKTANIVATKKIKPKEEIYSTYGAEYWRSANNRKKKKSARRR